MSRLYDFIKDYFWIVVTILALVFILSGCSILQPKPEPAEQTYDQILKQVAAGHDWLVTLSIVGVAISVAATLNGTKFGIPAAIGCLTSLGMALSVVRYAEWIAFLALIAAVGAFVWAVVMKNKAIRELVFDVDSKAQSKTTKKIVEKTCKKRREA